MLAVLAVIHNLVLLVAWVAVMGVMVSTVAQATMAEEVPPTTRVAHLVWGAQMPRLAMEAKVVTDTALVAVAQCAVLIMAGPRLGAAALAAGLLARKLGKASSATLWLAATATLATCKFNTPIGNGEEQWMIKR